MATHSSTLAWRIPQTEEPGRPQSIWSERVRHGWSNLVQHSTGENTWTCNTSRDKGACPWCESLIVTAVCGEGCVMELRKRKSIIAQLSVNWVGRGKQTHAHSLPLHFVCFPILSHSSIFHVLCYPLTLPYSGTSEKVWTQSQKQDPVEKNQVWYWIC